MGIRGFFHFMSANKQLSSLLFKGYKLKNTYLVMDGNNVMIFFYLYAKLPLKYGGEYDRYYRFLKKLFKDFIKCNVIPIVVFDGVFDEVKEKKLKRFNRKIRDLISLKYGKTIQLLPLMLSQVFKYVLKELNIISFTSSGEADKEIATIGKLLNCPVLSDDTDLCFFDVQYIMIRLMNFQLKVEENFDSGPNYYFDCAIFDRDVFKKYFNLGTDKFLLVPTLLGNHSEEPILKNFQKRLLNIPEKAERDVIIKNTLMWLKEIKNYDDVIGIILNSVESSEYDRMKNIINTVINYFKTDDISPYVKINKTDSLIEIDENIDRNMLIYPLSKFPDYLIKAYIKGIITPIFVKIIMGVGGYSSIQCEDIDEICADNITLPIFRGQIQIIDRILGLSTVIKLTQRRGSNLKVVHLPNSKNFLPNVTSEIFNERENDRKKLFFEVMDFNKTKRELMIDEESSFGDWSIFLIAVLYWMVNRKKYMKCNKFQLVRVEAIIVTALANHAEHVIKNFKNENEKYKFPNILKNISKREFATFGKKFVKLRKEMTDIKYSLSTIHGLALFQCCLRDVISLNNFLNYPFSVLNLSKFYSGIVAYNVNHFIKDSSFIENLFSEVPNLQNVYCYILKILHESSGTNIA